MQKQVLIVDEHDSFRGLLSLILAKEHRVVSARSAREALNWLSKGNLPDVIVTNTSESNAQTTTHFLADLQCSGLFANIPVVLLGGRQQAVGSEHFRALGVQEFVAKPFNPFQLQEKIRRITGTVATPVIRAEAATPLRLDRVAFG
jgi:CheY-like chemotaxis protein